ncbi:hypothetical protein [Shewanella sp. KT0246]|uniref:hypothetical protein n=1 Tax=Shewanella sp. KT0246 TaxID=2815912 RepID=UPI001BC2674F|nr:hypothetical protein [Shewanella sp. KT0246]GIU48260.1 hypothetical protein TUM4249_03070 [Shewanella sp. KT0246]
MEGSDISVEIESEIKRRKVYSRFDYILNNILVFITVIASSFAGFSQVFEYKNSAVIAAIASIPAFILLLQKTFKWEQRSEWHWDYRRRLISIHREMRDQGLSPSDASKKINKLEEQLAGSFPSLNRPASKE